MNQFEAVNAAADFIENNPKLYRFMAVNIPEEDNAHGCVLGFIGRYLGLTGMYDAASRMMGHTFAEDFYDDVEELGNLGAHFGFARPNELVPALRQYAIVKFGHQGPGSPRSVGTVATVTNLDERRAA